jgi:transglutaminase-like putative cysteine protease
VIYDIHHVTTYEYGSPVKFAHCALRLTPIDLPGQTVLETAITIDPAPSQSTERVCFFGNKVTSLTIATEHSDLIVSVDTAIDVDRGPPPQAGATAPFEAVREEAFDSESLDKASPAHFLHPSRFVPRFAPAADYARTSFSPGRPVREGATELMRRIRADFKYDTKATQVSTPISEAFQKRRGVCQDFAHIMIAGLRGLGLPAAYVSGYIRTIPPPGKKRLQGADAMHAWVSIWCGADVGWVDLDPTNSMLIGNDHIVLARGRDYADISPVAGIILGTREQDVDVEVDVIPRGEDPPEPRPTKAAEGKAES